MDLFHVIQTSNLEQLTEYIRNNCARVELKAVINKKSGDNLMTHAAKHGKSEIIQWLHETGDIKVDQTNFDGKTPLHEASQNGHVGCIEYLLSRGAAIDCLKKADW